ncbi:hypothetical protein SAMN05216489_02745 [Streptomyces sp. 3213]|uniref:hypothetical protein n=1 Tax=Streptomyces sp. 3213.3 TaxID=1855348 RepID=UPI00089A15BD|nr:hypothetical protein [Streptomyces sp. 3213.3]SED18445.1 hypothetical protein SAMN05216489_02745 [Streptomyces sp. 3213] [Streptomyces sp. 3213.3]
MGIWDVKKDNEREQWVFVPQVGVGPLRFGMAPDEVSAALGSNAPVSRLVQRSSGNYELVEAQFTELGVTAYYGTRQALACVAVDVLAGPQVMLDGVFLVARVPSEAEDWLCKHTEVHELDLIYTHAADPGSADLGLILRAQRAGDIVLTRPLFLIREWAENSWDCIPGEEWSRF